MKVLTVARADIPVPDSSENASCIILLYVLVLVLVMYNHDIISHKSLYSNYIIMHAA